MLPQLHNFSAYDNGLEDSQSIMSFARCAGIHLGSAPPSKVVSPSFVWFGLFWGHNCWRLCRIACLSLVH